MRKLIWILTCPGLPYRPAVVSAWCDRGGKKKKEKKRRATAAQSETIPAKPCSQSLTTYVRQDCLAPTFLGLKQSAAGLYNPVPSYHPAGKKTTTTVIRQIPRHTATQVASSATTLLSAIFTDPALRRLPCQRTRGKRSLLRYAIIQARSIIPSRPRVASLSLGWSAASVWAWRYLHSSPAGHGLRAIESKQTDKRASLDAVREVLCIYILPYR